MFIKELEITGFKSFAQKTKVGFTHPITAVIGPNGCGKSNILDSLKWVLGEKSVRSIRGEKSEDIIFSGTDSKKPASYVQVAVTFHNQTRVLPIEMDEVKISRRMYRDGQSQYFLNETRVARREIENLLMDTGVGKSSYSFMEQGQMDMILSSKPEERRVIFEEAAGIARFKSQQEEAEKNLENTRLNLTRVLDIQRELERELKIKKSQAEKTGQYNQLKKDQKEHDLRIRYLTVQEINKSLDNLQDRLQRKMQDREKANQKTLQYEEQVLLLEEEKEKNRHNLHQKDVTNQISREKIQQWQKGLLEFAGRRQVLGSEADNLKELMRNLDNHLKGLKKDLHSQTQLTLELDLHLQDAMQTQSEIEDKIRELDLGVEKAIISLAEASEKQKDNQENLRQLRQKLEVVIQDLLKSLKEEKNRWQAQEEQRQEKKNSLSGQISAFGLKLEEFLQLLQQGPDLQTLPGQFEKLLQGFGQNEWLAEISQLAELGEGLRHLLFEKGGIHSQKEELDEAVSRLEKENESLEQRKIELQKQIEWQKEEKSRQLTQKEIVLGEIKNFNLKKDNLREREKSLKEQIAHDDSQLQYFRSKFNRLEGEMMQLDSDEKKLNSEIVRLQAGIQKEVNEIENLEKNISRLEKKKSEMHELIRKEIEKNRQIFDETNELEVKIGTLLGSREVMVQDIYNDYNITLDEVKEILGNSRIQLNQEKGRLHEIQKTIEALGPINPLAIEEYKSIEEYYNHNKTQIEDIESARSHIETVIREIHEKSENMFLESFNQIQNNFRQIFQKLFSGGDATLTLQDPAKPLESGIEIQVQPPGKRARSLRLLSGGEKALTAISLMFGIYMVKSSPFCVMDEIDAPLDDQNVSRFLKLLEEFRHNTQFILITHNKKTMASADVIYGVTMDEPGVSKLLAVELKSA